MPKKIDLPPVAAEGEVQCSVFSPVAAERQEVDVEGNNNEDISENNNNNASKNNDDTAEEAARRALEEETADSPAIPKPQKKGRRRIDRYIPNSDDDSDELEEINHGGGRSGGPKTTGETNEDDSDADSRFSADSANNNNGNNSNDGNNSERINLEELFNASDEDVNVRNENSNINDGGGNDNENNDGVVRSNTSNENSSRLRRIIAGGSMNQDNGAISSPVKIIDAPRQRRKRKLDNQKKERSRKQTKLFTYASGHMKIKEEKSKAAHRTLYDKYLRRENKEAYKAKRKVYDEQVANEKQIAKAADRKPRHIPMGLKARAAPPSYHGLSYHSIHNGAMTKRPDDTFDGRVIRSQYEDWATVEIRDRTSTNIVRHTQLGIGCDIIKLNISLAIEDLYIDWSINRYKMNEKCDSDQHIRDAENYVHSMEKRGLDLLADGSIVDLSNLINGTCDSIELIAYAKNGGCLYHCANMINAPRLIEIVDHYLKEGGNRGIAHLLEEVLEYDYVLQFFGLCRASLVGRGQSRCLQQFSIDGFLIALDPSDHVSTLVEDKKNDKPLVVVYQAASTLMIGTDCFHRCLQVAQYFHFRRKGNKNVIIKMPENQRKIIDEVKNRCGVSSSNRGKDQDTSKLLSQKTNEDIDDVVRYMYNCTGDTTVIHFVHKEYYQTMMRPHKLCLHTYTRHIKYEDGAIPQDGNYETIREIFFELLDVVRTQLPVKKLSQQDAEDAIEAVLKGVSISDPMILDTIQARVQDYIGKLAEIPMAALLHPIMARLLVGNRRGSIWVRKFPLQLLQHTSIYVGHYEKSLHLHRGDRHQCRIRCKLCNSDHGIKYHINESTFPLVFSMAPIFALVHYGIVSYDEDWRTFATFDLRESKTDFRCALDYLRRNVFPAVQICEKVISPNLDNANDMTLCTIDAIRQDLYDIHDSSCVSKNTRQLMELAIQKYDEIKSCLVMLKFLCNTNFKTVMDGKKWIASVLVEKVTCYTHPLLVEIVGTGSVRSHVVIFFDGHVLCPESKESYPCSMRNLNYACGEHGVFDCARRVFALIPNKEMKSVYDKKRENVGLKSYNWDSSELSTRKKKKKKKNEQNGLDNQL